MLCHPGLLTCPLTVCLLKGSLVRTKVFMLWKKPWEEHKGCSKMYLTKRTRLGLVITSIFLYFHYSPSVSVTLNHLLQLKELFSSQRDPGSLCITTFPLNSGKGLTTWASCSRYMRSYGACKAEGTEIRQIIKRLFQDLCVFSLEVFASTDDMTSDWWQFGKKLPPHTENYFRKKLVQMAPDLDA